MNVNWGILVVLYLFLAGMAGGIYFTCAMCEFLGENMKKTVHKGYVLSFCLLIAAVFLLILDLEKPGRFINMMLAYKFFSPMSMGSWGLFFFGINTFATIAINAEGSLGRLGALFLRVVPYKLYLLIGAALSVFLTAYTGVLLGETTITLWSSTPFLGALFLASGISCGVCVMMLMERDNEVFIRKGKVFDNLCLVVELAVIVLFVLALTIGYGPYPETKRLFSGIYGMMFIGGGIIVGTLLPLFINMLGSKGRLSPVLVLVGAFMLRYAIVYAGQQ